MTNVVVNPKQHAQREDEADRIFGRGFRCVGDDLRGYFVEARYAGDPRVWMVPNTYPEGR